MKRSPLPPRKKYIERSKKKIPRLNVERAKRRRDAYSAYLRSPEWKEKKRLVRERSGGRCERFTLTTRSFWTGNLVDDDPHSQTGAIPTFLYRSELTRCWHGADVVNHKTYRRFGRENLSDLEHLCQMHNDEYESARPWRAQRRLALSRAEKAAS